MRKKNGFTLIEIMVVLALIAGITSILVSRLSRALDWDLKNTSRRFASVIQYLYQKAGSEGVTLRIVFDLEKQAYSVEGTTDLVSLVREEEVPKDKEGEKKSVFSPKEIKLLGSLSLPKGVFFKDIWVEHQLEKRTAGQAYLYFFPHGYVERAVINFRNKKDNANYSLEVFPLGGKVKIEPNYKEPRIER